MKISTVSQPGPLTAAEDFDGESAWLHLPSHFPALAACPATVALAASGRVETGQLLRPSVSNASNSDNNCLSGSDRTQLPAGAPQCHCAVIRCTGLGYTCGTVSVTGMVMVIAGMIAGPASLLIRRDQPIFMIRTA